MKRKYIQVIDANNETTIEVSSNYEYKLNDLKEFKDCLYIDTDESREYANVINLSFEDVLELQEFINGFVDENMDLYKESLYEKELEDIKRCREGYKNKVVDMLNKSLEEVKVTNVLIYGKSINIENNDKNKKLLYAMGINQSWIDDFSDDNYIYINSFIEDICKYKDGKFIVKWGI